jgi:hypothetical protein
VLKIKLTNSFAMKELGVAKKILVMRTRKDRKYCNLKLSLGECIGKVFEIFKIKEAKPIITALASHFKLTKQMSPDT